MMRMGLTKEERNKWWFDTLDEFDAKGPVMPRALGLARAAEAAHLQTLNAARKKFKPAADQLGMDWENLTPEELADLHFAGADLDVGLEDFKKRMAKRKEEKDKERIAQHGLVDFYRHIAQSIKASEEKAHKKAVEKNLENIKKNGDVGNEVLKKINDQLRRLPLGFA